MARARSDNIAPVAAECDIPELATEGTLPPGLDGVLFRNGPNPQFELPGAHWFLGDGMIHAVSLHDGRAAYRNRWVRTARYRAEQAAGRALPRIEGDQGRANTNVLFHHGRLLALEEAHAPLALCPHTLRTIGPDACAGHQPFTAHPKRDPRSGSLVFFGYASRGPFSTAIRCGELSADGRLAWEIEVETPFAAMVHDCAVTEHFVVIPLLPLAGSLERVEHGGPPFLWEPRKGAHLAVVRRGGDASDVGWHHAPPHFAFHVVNAWEEDATIRIDLLQYDAPPLFPRADTPAPDEREGASPWRWTVPLRPGAEVAVRQLDTLTGEFPRIDERSAGTAHRYSWMACRDPGRSADRLNALARLDHRAGGHVLHAFAAEDEVSEPVFVPRTPDAAEGDGWLLALHWSAARDLSDLVVFEAQALADGPIAIVQLPCRVPAGFHGNWVERGELERRRAA